MTCIAALEDAIVAFSYDCLQTLPPRLDAFARARVVGQNLPHELRCHGEEMSALLDLWSNQFGQSTNVVSNR